MSRSDPSARLQRSTSHRDVETQPGHHVPPVWWIRGSMASVALAVSACVVSSVQPMTVPLVYKPSPKQLGLVNAFPCNAVARVQATDARTDKTLGLRTHETKALKAEVSASGDAAAWIEDGVQKYLTQAGIHFQGGGPALIMSLDSLRTSESILRRSSYEARIGLSSRLQSAAGKTCWEGKADGTAGNYGYSGDILDYQETLNGALNAAIVHIGEAAGFRDALCHCAD